MKPLEALFLDLDGTLLDGSGYCESIVRTCGRIAADRPELDATRLVDANAAVWVSCWPGAQDKWMLGALDGACVSLEVWRRTLQACGCNDESAAQLAARIHRQPGSETYRLFFDVCGLFTSAKTAGAALALVTNGASDTQRDKLRILGIEDWFDAVVISGEVGLAKPDAGIFGVALDELAVDSRDVWHVGDSLTADVAGAKAADLTAGWLNRTGSSRGDGDPKPDIEIRSLPGLVSILTD